MFIAVDVHMYLYNEYHLKVYGSEAVFLFSPSIETIDWQVTYLNPFMSRNYTADPEFHGWI